MQTQSDGLSGLRALLGQIFGSKDVSRTVAGTASAQTDIDLRFLTNARYIAMLVAGYLPKQSGGGASEGELGSVLGNFLAGALGGGKSQDTASAGIGGIRSSLDLDDDGNQLDDVLRNGW